MRQNKLNLIFMFSLGFVLLGCQGDLPSLSLLYKDHLARKDIKSEKYEEALGQYYKLLEEDGERSTTHSNIGVLLDMQQKKDEALKSLQHALKLAETKKNPEEIFLARYNLGVYFGSLKKVKEALENYQVALDLKPSSHEIKTNIELLIQQQQQDQQQKQQQQSKDGDQKQNSNGEGQQNQDKKDGDDQNKNNPENNENKQGENQEKQDEKDGKDKDQPQQKQSSPKYQPRPFKGDQLSEGDVKKILGELRNQEQKIRANFDKKEKGKTKNNDKDW